MNLRQTKAKSLSFDHPLWKGKYPELSDEDKANLILQIVEGSYAARDRVIEGHIKLGLDIVGRYLFRLNSVRLKDDLVSAAMLAITGTVEKIRKGEKVLYDYGITPVIVEAIHRAISHEIEETPLIHVPGSTKRTRDAQGKETTAPKCYHLTEADRTHETHVGAGLEADSVQTQGWWKGQARRGGDSESEIREVLDKVLQSPLERSIAELRTTYIDGKPMSDRAVAQALGVSHTTVFLIRKDIGARLKKELQ